MKFKILLILTILIAATGFKCGGKGGTPKPPTLDLSCETTQRSSAENGAYVCSKNGQNQTVLTAIDATLRELSNDVDHLGYAAGRLPSDYVVLIYDKCQLSPESQSPSFLVDGGSHYDGTEYDQWNPKGKGVKDGASRIFAAEMVIADGWGQLTNGYIVCADAIASQYFRDSVRFGAEHIMLWKNDREKFNATAYHQTGGHPLIARTSQGLRDASEFPKDVVPDFLYPIIPKGFTVEGGKLRSQ